MDINRPNLLLGVIVKLKNQASDNIEESIPMMLPARTVNEIVLIYYYFLI